MFLQLKSETQKRTAFITADTSASCNTTSGYLCHCLDVAQQNEASLSVHPSIWEQRWQRFLAVGSLLKCLSELPCCSSFIDHTSSEAGLGCANAFPLLSLHLTSLLIYILHPISLLWSMSLSDGCVLLNSAVCKCLREDTNTSVKAQQRTYCSV